MRHHLGQEGYFHRRNLFMTATILEKLFEHNNWANRQIMEACSTLSDEQFDTEPQSASYGSIRSTLLHLASAQQSYLRLLTLPLEERQDSVNVDFVNLQKSITSSGDGLLALARDESRLPQAQIQTRDGHLVDAWVVMIQVINHATEHREQIKNMLTGLGMTPPSIDGWDYGEVAGALVPLSS
jgi:uncharacterized damage-inducible protein DinB